ncbi:MAG: ABC transporter permease [Planctomycetes bacterium]|nr:ABC transporter permease [Planctomycetota bacterium]
MSSHSTATHRRPGLVMSVLKNNIGIICVLLIIGVILSFMSEFFLTKDNLISVLRQISNNIYLALAMTFVMILGGIDLSVGAIVAMCGTLTVGFIVTQKMPMATAIPLGLLLGTCFGFFNGCIVAFFRLPAFIVTLATMNIARGIAFVYSGGRSTRIVDDGFNAVGTGYWLGIPYPVIYMVILIFAFTVLLNRTRFGTYIYAVGGNREAAHLSGVPINRTIITVFTLSGLLSAFAGLVLCSRMYSGQPSIGQGYEMDAIAACVLGGVSMSGGVGRVSGTVFGTIVIGLISNGLNLMGVSSFWQLIVKGIIILIAVLIDSQKGQQSFVHRLIARLTSR